MDDYLKKYSLKYDSWLDQDLIDYSSKVIPVHEALSERKHILPVSQAETILKKAETIALAKCICRDRYKNCDKPLEVCFILNSKGEKWIEKDLAKPIDMTRARQVLKQANKSGLVHMTLYQPDHEVFALCSCCSCCCHDLQLVLTYGKTYITTKSDYVAEDNADDCILCGECVDRCPFNARAFSRDSLDYRPEACYGCGLCITTCPENAITLIKKQKA